jgi:hypothetical protein
MGFLGKRVESKGPPVTGECRRRVGGEKLGSTYGRSEEIEDNNEKVQNLRIGTNRLKWTKEASAASAAACPHTRRPNIHPGVPNIHQTRPTSRSGRYTTHTVWSILPTLSFIVRVRQDTFRDSVFCCDHHQSRFCLNLVLAPQLRELLQ